jgi:hypothetical protein
VIELNSNAIGLGEISRVHELLERGSQCACGKSLAACPFWASALQDLRQTAPLVAWSKTSWLERGKLMRRVLATMTGISSLAPRTERQSAQALDVALSKLETQAGTSLLIDTSKEPSEFLRLTLLTSRAVVPVHLIRDPRAVAWSGFRRTGTDPLAIAGHWARLNRAIAWLRQLTPGFPWQVVRYEDFCLDTQSVSRRLLEAVGGRVETRPSKANHALGGSSGFTLEDSHDIAIDERWKAEMPEALQRRIMQTVGGTARKFGYT